MATIYKKKISTFIVNLKNLSICEYWKILSYYTSKSLEEPLLYACYSFWNLTMNEWASGIWLIYRLMYIDLNKYSAMLQLEKFYYIYII